MMRLRAIKVSTIKRLKGIAHKPCKSFVGLLTSPQVSLGRNSLYIQNILTIVTALHGQLQRCLSHLKLHVESFFILTAYCLWHSMAMSGNKRTAGTLNPWPLVSNLSIFKQITFMVQGTYNNCILQSRIQSTYTTYYTLQK